MESCKTKAPSPYNYWGYLLNDNCEVTLTTVGEQADSIKHIDEEKTGAHPGIELHINAKSKSENADNDEILCNQSGGQAGRATVPASKKEGFSEGYTKPKDKNEEAVDNSENEDDVMLDSDYRPNNAFDDEPYIYARYNKRENAFIVQKMPQSKSRLESSDPTKNLRLCDNHEDYIQILSKEYQSYPKPQLLEMLNKAKENYRIWLDTLRRKRRKF